MKCLDTTVAIDHLRGHVDATELVAATLRNDGQLFASEIVRFELFAGVRDAERDKLRRFVDALSWVPIAHEVSQLAGELARRYRRSHSGIDAADYLIAATATLLGAELLTVNIRHFPMLEGLRPAYAP